MECFEREKGERQEVKSRYVNSKQPFDCAQLIKSPLFAVYQVVFWQKPFLSYI